MDWKRLEKILEQHELWINSNCKQGDRADLRDANLRNANLRNANLKGANLRWADLRNANLRNANLRNADLRGVDLRNANLRNANLKGANLRWADLRNADLRGVDLRNANLSNAFLSDADLKGIKYDEGTSFFALQCPEEGSFIGYKKANGYIVTLKITKDAKRSSATSRKCRCSKAKVLDIENIDTGNKVNIVESNYNENFIYKVGEIVEEDNFDKDRWNECSNGIHFFITKQEAINY